MRGEDCSKANRTGLVTEARDRASDGERDTPTGTQVILQQLGKLKGCRNVKWEAGPQPKPSPQQECGRGPG